MQWIQKFKVIFTLRAKLIGAVYCYRSCLWRVGRQRVFVCGSVTTITRKDFGRPAPPGRGSVAGQKFLTLPLQPVRSVCVSLSTFFISNRGWFLDTSQISDTGQVSKVLGSTTQN